MQVSENNLPLAPFESLLYKAGIKYHLLGAFIAFIYNVFFAFYDKEHLLAYFLFYAIIICFAEFIIAPLSIKMMTRYISKKIEIFRFGKTFDAGERTDLLEDVMHFPVINGVSIFFYMVVCFSTLCIFYRCVIGVNPDLLISGVIGFLFCSYYIALFSFKYSYPIVSMYSEAIVSKGVDNEYISKYRFFCLSLPASCVLFIVIPFFLSSFVIFYFFFDSCIIDGNIVMTQELLVRAIVVISVNMILNLFLANEFRFKLQKSLHKMREATTALVKEYESNNFTIDTDLSDEMSYNLYLLKLVTNTFQKILQNIDGISQDILDTTDVLVDVSDESARIYNEEVASSSEIVSTMNEARTLSENTSGRIQNLASIASIMRNDVEDGNRIVGLIKNQIHDIEESNSNTIQKIQNLGLLVADVQSIINVMNDIAEQTKIISVNAELEAISAGDVGHNFHIVATEINRLASNTILSINKIQANINEVSNAKKELLSMSEDCMTKILEEKNLIVQVEDSFSAINQSAFATSNKSVEISRIIDQQNNSFLQIEDTLIQMKSVMDNFTNLINELDVTEKDLANQSARLKHIDI